MWGLRTQARPDQAPVPRHDLYVAQGEWERVVVGGGGRQTDRQTDRQTELCALREERALQADPLPPRCGAPRWRIIQPNKEYIQAKKKDAVRYLSVSQKDALRASRG